MTYDDAKKAFVLSRIRTDKPYSDTAIHAAENCFGLLQRLSTVQAQATADTHLSEAGRRAKLAEAAKAMTRDLAEVSRPIRKALGDVQQRRATLRPKEPDRTDMVAELRRQELRSFVRGLPPEQRFSTVASDAQIVEAVLDAVPALSGLAPERFKLLEEERVKTQFGEQLAALQEQEDVFANANAAADIARSQLRAASGLSVAQFEELMAPLEKAADAR